MLLLNAIYEQDFIDYSFGYRPGTGAKDAISELTFRLQFGPFGYIVEADIRSFFDNKDHDRLLRMLAERIDDKAFIYLIRKWLNRRSQRRSYTWERFKHYLEAYFNVVLPFITEIKRRSRIAF